MGLSFCQGPREPTHFYPKQTRRWVRANHVTAISENFKN